MKAKKSTSGENQMKGIDWKEIHHRLEIIRTSLDQGFVPTPEEKKAILKDRARSLAREPEEESASEENLEVIEFLLAYEKYGIESGYVQEVYPLKEVTPLPGTPSFLTGIINVRGQILSVIDIKKFFDLPEKGLTDLNKAIILQNDRTSPGKVETMEFGILADAILGVRQIPLTDIQSSLPTLAGIREEYLRGVTSERVVILDAEKLLSDKKIFIHEEVGG